MSEAIVITSIITGGAVLIAAVGFCNVEGLKERSVFGQLIEAWREARAQRHEVAKLKAQHAAVCPRLTDTPRERR